MGLFDDSVIIGTKKEIDPIKVTSVPDDKVFVENSLDRSITEKINPLVKVEVINKKYNLGALLTNLGYDITGSNMYCPFHPDEATGKPSAKYHKDTDLLYCFSENKMFSAYHALKLLYGVNMDKVFMDIWSKMSLDERHNVMEKYDEHGSDIANVSSEWEKYKKLVLDKFRTREVNYTQYKNALYKVMMIVEGTEGGVENG